MKTIESKDKLTARPDWLSPELYPFHSRFFNYHGSKIHYLDEGDGLPTRLFVEDAMVIADGGGKARGALRHILQGADKAGKFIIGATQKLRPEGATFSYKIFNGAPALLGKLEGKPFLVLSISHNGERITALYALANPDKLTHLVQ